MLLQIDLIDLDADTIDRVEVNVSDIEAAHAAAQAAGDCVVFDVLDDDTVYAVAHRIC